MTFFFALGFRPFFLLAGGWAVIALAAWLAQLTGYLELPSRFAAAHWHSHEMIHGYTQAAIAGFLLTAIPNWTNRPALQGLPLAAMAVLWIAGRVTMATSEMLPVWLAPIVDAAFPAWLMIYAAREIMASGNKRNLPIVLVLLLLTITNFSDHAAAVDWIDDNGAAQRGGLALIWLLICLIGGRVIPAFTRNWLVTKNVTRLPVPANRLDMAIILATAAVLAWWVALPEGNAGWGLALVGAAHVIRMSRWRGEATTSEALVWIMHVGYGWLAFGLLLYGLALATGFMAPRDALHAPAAGAITVMTLGIMVRAILGHSNWPLTADGGTLGIFALLNAAIVLRLLASYAEAGETMQLSAAGCMAFAYFLFVWRYYPLLCRKILPPLL